MKTIWPWLGKLFIVFIVIEGWFIYDFYTKNQLLITENLVLESELLQSQQNLAKAEEKIQILEKSSVKGMLEETNKAIMSSWESILDTVKRELEQARDTLSSTEKVAPDGPKKPSQQGGAPLMPREGENLETPESSPSVIQGERT